MESNHSASVMPALVAGIHVFLAATLGTGTGATRAQGTNGENWEVLHTLAGHLGGVNSVAFSSDGKQALSGSGRFGDGFRLWDLATGQALKTVTGKALQVTSVAFSPDGKQALWGSFDGTVRLWDLATGQTLKTLTGHTGGVRSVAFSPLGSRALSASEDKTLRLWDLATGQTLLTLTGHTGDVNSVTFSPDGKRALSGSDDWTLRLWDLATGQTLKTLTGHTKEVRSVAFSPDVKQALSGSLDKTLRVWDLANGQTLMIRAAEVSWSVAFSPDGKRALSGNYDGTVRLWDLATGQIVKTLTAPTIGRPVADFQRSVMSVAISPDGKRALSGSSDGTVRLLGDPSAYVALPVPAPRVAAETPPSARSKEPPKTAAIASPTGPKSSAPPPERFDPGAFSNPTPAPEAAGLPKLAQPSPAPRTAIWTQLSKDARPPQLRNKQSTEELFAKARSSVWVVIAATSMAHNDATSQISQGSAVAITRSRLLTNYHVVEGQRFVFVKQGDDFFEATVVAGDKDSDRCMLAVKGEPLTPVDGLRGFGELRVGEPVYTIGSPSGLESTLGQGIVSGLRTVAGQQLVQTTAPISPGSSGGGLFDSAGNLVGITSFMLKNSQGLNFAIAAEDYFR
jgi:hypothetical protein